ncbi:MAG TPA: hypothetical protein PLE61_10195 [Vicinamibacterales bacterium]|nr:hypothetical protein [Vicinamibacterales bacterium]
MMNRERLTTEWTEFLSHPSVEHSLNLRLELTLKQRRKNPELRTLRSTKPPRVEYGAKKRSLERLPASDTVVLFTRQKIARINADVDAAARRAKRGPRTLEQANALAPYFYLTADETRRIAIRVMNRLNKKIFNHAARDKRAPKRLTALVCQHDKGTRRHLHILLALPPDVADNTFDNALAYAIAESKEPFIYRISRAPERIKDLAASIRYNANDFKTLSQNAILYIHTQPDPSHASHGETQNELELAAANDHHGTDADDGDRLSSSRAR